MLFRVFSTEPTTALTGETSRLPSGDSIRFHGVIGWLERGTVQAPDEFAALAKAKEQWGGSPVIERATLH